MTETSFDHDRMYTGRTALLRHRPLDRASARRRVTLVRHRGLHTDPVWTAVRKVVWERCGGRDEYSGEPLDPALWECHHRKFRSRGGRHSACNAVALTPRRHRSVHNAGQIEAQARGFVLASTVDPAAVPVRLWDGRLVLLAHDGAYAPALTEESA